MTKKKDNKEFSDPNYSEKLEPDRLGDKGLHNIHKREHQEPTELMAPVPMVLIFIFFILGFWGGMYLSRYSGEFRGDVYDPNWKPVAEATVVKEFDPIKQGAKLFARNCQQCHQQNGQGIPGVYPPLNESEWVLGDDIRLVKILLAGLNGEIIVKGEKYVGNMPNFAHWKDRDIAAVLTWIRGRTEWGNDAPAVPVELVTQTREDMSGRSKPWKPEELLKEHPF